MRRLLFQDVIHATMMFDLFFFEPSLEGYTCDYVDADGVSGHLLYTDFRSEFLWSLLDF